MSTHARFESLLGAIVLGEATAAERAAFDGHAAACARCREDAAGAPIVVTAIADARGVETWRPMQPIVDRVRARRRARTRFTLGALGYGIVGSLVLNVAVAAGIGSQVSGLFATIAAPVSVGSRLSLQAARPIPVVTHPALLAVTLQHRPTASRSYVHATRLPVRAGAAGPGATAAESPEPTLADMPDLLAGIERGESTRHAVAVEALPRCANADLSDADISDAVRPCRDEAGHVER